MPAWSKYWEKIRPYREHIGFILLSFIVGGFAQERKLAILIAGLLVLLFILLAALRLGTFAWIVGLLSSAIASERLPSDKRLILILFFTVLGFTTGWLAKRRRMGKGKPAILDIGKGESTIIKTKEKKEENKKTDEGKVEGEKKIPYEKEVPCRFCGRLISKAELECPYCRKKQYDLSEINTLLEKKGRIQEALDNLELRFMNGDVDSEIYKSLKRKWNVRLADIEEKIISSQMKH